MNPWWAVRALRQAPVGLVVIRRSRIRFANRRAEQVLGPDPAPALAALLHGPVAAGGTDRLDTVAIDATDAARSDPGHARSDPEDGRVRATGTVVLADGSRRRLTAVGTRLGRGAGSAWVFVVLDARDPLVPVTEALTDSLTGLPNRRMLMQELEAARGRRAGAGRDTLAFVDLDGFKGINDRYGHGTGDRVLCEIARRLRQALPDDAVMARFGGDEFAILLPDTPPGSAVDLLERLAQTQARTPVVIDGVAIPVGFSAGVAEADAPTIGQALARADRACYHAKANQRGHCAVFDADSGALRTRREMHEQIDRLAAEKSHLERVSLTDHLTGLPNTRALDRALDDLDRSGDGGTVGYALLFIDLDRFGTYNHRHGDAAGDAALRRVAQCLRENCRDGETAFRKGGEELVVVLAGCDEQAAPAVGERLRRAVEDLALPHGGHPDTPVVTITVAVVTARDGVAAHTLLDHAARGAFATKEERRRNRVVVAAAGPGPA